MPVNVRKPDFGLRNRRSGVRISPGALQEAPQLRHSCWIWAIRRTGSEILKLRLAGLIRRTLSGHDSPAVLPIQPKGGPF
jgi:hypothetical protein